MSVARLYGGVLGGLRLRRPNAMRRAAAALLALLVALPAGDLRALTSSGTIQGVVRMEGRPLSGVTVAFIELQSGAVVRATSGADGAFTATAPAGEYAVTTESQAGLTVGQAPVRVVVADGRVATADVALVAVATAVPQEPAAAGQAPPPAAPPAENETPPSQMQAPAGPVWAETSGTGAQIRFEPVTCFVAGEFPLLDAGIEPMASVARARVYFKGSTGTSFYYVEMSQDQGRFFGKLPRPRVEASPITYYLQSTTTEFEESQTREIDALVVQDKSDCGDRKVAAFGPPGSITIFSASTGVTTLAPAGFAAAAASGIVVGVVTLIASGAAAAGIVGGVVGGPGTGATPPPVLVTPSPIPIPTPIPTGTPPAPITTFR
ncbi:MAG TPA: carboxypeptidase-like regulatory domain-containing protein [Vicinamibacteria bacterium]|nr:carboxypeptidase-like regulatory domain-containing protein [Vicinamibacteria bacterium]